MSALVLRIKFPAQVCRVLVCEGPFLGSKDLGPPLMGRFSPRWDQVSSLKVLIRLCKFWLFLFFASIQYPLIYKTLRVDANFTTKEAVRFIADTVNVTSLLVGTEGLYIPDEKRWLDDDAILSTYDSLQDVVRSRFIPFLFLYASGRWLENAYFGQYSSIQCLYLSGFARKPSEAHRRVSKLERLKICSPSLLWHLSWLGLIRDIVFERFWRKRRPASCFKGWDWLSKHFSFPILDLVLLWSITSANSGLIYGTTSLALLPFVGMSYSRCRSLSIRLARNLAYTYTPRHLFAFGTQKMEESRFNSK